MQRIISVSILAIFVILISVTISPVNADRRDLHCYLEASTVDVKVEVWEEDRLGNKGQLIWRGLIEKGHRQRINARTGGIRYASSVYVNKNEPLSGDQSRWCEEGGTVGVP